VSTHDEDFDLLAASLRADGRDVDQFFSVLAAKLADALPDRVELTKGGLLGRSKPKAIAVTLGDARYEAERQGHQITCARRTIVRGIALKSEDLTVEAWIERLSEDLLAEARQSERARLALESLLEQ
jgi:hypothetical protein